MGKTFVVWLSHNNMLLILKLHPYTSLLQLFSLSKALISLQLTVAFCQQDFSYLYGHAVTRTHGPFCLFLCFFCV